MVKSVLGCLFGRSYLGFLVGRHHLVLSILVLLKNNHVSKKFKDDALVFGERVLKLLLTKSILWYMYLVYIVLSASLYSNQTILHFASS